MPIATHSTRNHNYLRLKTSIICPQVQEPFLPTSAGRQLAPPTNMGRHQEASALSGWCNSPLASFTVAEISQLQGRESLGWAADLCLTASHSVPRVESATSSRGKFCKSNKATFSRGSWQEQRLEQRSSCGGVYLHHAGGKNVAVFRKTVAGLLVPLLIRKCLIFQEWFRTGLSKCLTGVISKQQLF